MSDTQLYIAAGAPMLFNALLITILILWINARFSSQDERFHSVATRFDAINTRFDAIDKRFDDMRDLWRAELHRVEEVLDARLKHLEESR